MVDTYNYASTKRTISRLDTSAKLSISLRLREVVQILVKEVLKWQVKPWENIRSFLNTCHFKSLFTITSYFRSLFPPFWLSTEHCCWYYWSRIKAHRWQLWLYYWVLTYKQLLKTSRIARVQSVMLSAVHNPKTPWFFIVLYESDSFSFFIHIYDEWQQGSIAKLCQWQVIHNDDNDFPQAKWDR